ncbi:hypothetical protein ACIA8K_38905 [Catenuloplanes sp. NPDC051500]|uniref:hypothetical protein n=1 Tax=Catenuloplanes sp. NPDC051500 TaxID=3363959 RepID=UPI00378AFD0A
MPTNTSHDTGLRHFEEDAVRRPHIALRTLSEWAGQVWYENRYVERYGAPEAATHESTVARERLLAVIRARLPHLDSSSGNGHSCDCRYLKIALGAFDRERLAETRRRYLTATATIASGTLAFLMLVLAFWYLNRASTLTSDRAFGFTAGISGGLVVGTIQMVVTITTLLTERIAEGVEWRWFHPDSEWLLAGSINPRHRRRIRHAHLRRAADVVLRVESNRASSRSAGHGFGTRLRFAYEAFALGPRRP